MRGQAGHSLLGVLVGLAIAGPLLMTATTGMQVSAQRLKREKQNLERVEIENAVSFYLSQAAQGLDSARFNTIRIHEQGHFNDGEGVAVRLTYKVEPHSSALTASIMTAAGSAWVVQRSIETDTLTAYVCSQTIGTAVNFDTRSVIGLSTEGFFELLLLNARIANNGCSELRLKATRSVLTPTATSTTLEFISRIYPVEIFSIYLAKNNDIRFLSHAGEQIIENQPLSKGPAHLNFSIHDGPFHGLKLLKAHLAFDDIQRELTAAHFLSHLPLAIVLGNRGTP